MDAMFLNEASSSLDLDHKQKARLDLSNFKCMKLTKEFIKAHSGMHMFKGVAPNSKTCGAAVWVDDDGEPVATVAVGYPDEHRSKDDRYNWIGNMEINPKYRGHDLSSQVLDYAVHQLGGDALAVLAKNKVAKHVYDKYGFRTSKDSELAVGRKHSSYYQMFLREDIGTSVGELLETHAISADPYEGPGGKKHALITVGDRNRSMTTYELLHRDVLHNLVEIRPFLIKKNEVALLKDAQDVADYLNQIAKRNSAASNIASWRILRDMINDDMPLDKMEGLLPNWKSKAERRAYIDELIEIIDDQYTAINDFIRLTTEYASSVLGRAAKESASTTDRKLFLAADRWIRMEKNSVVSLEGPKDQQTTIYDLRRFGRGRLYIAKTAWDKHLRTDVGMLADALAVTGKYDIVVMVEGDLYDEDPYDKTWNIEPIYVPGYKAPFTDVKKLVKALDPNGDLKLKIVACNPKNLTLDDADGRYDYGTHRVYHDSVSPKAYDSSYEPEEVLKYYMVALAKLRAWKVEMDNTLFNCSILNGPKDVPFLKLRTTKTQLGCQRIKVSCTKPGKFEELRNAWYANVKVYERYLTNAITLMAALNHKSNMPLSEESNLYLNWAWLESPLLTDTVNVYNEAIHFDPYMESAYGTSLAWFNEAAKSIPIRKAIREMFDDFCEAIQHVGGHNILNFGAIVDSVYTDEREAWLEGRIKQLNEKQRGEVSPNNSTSLDEAIAETGSLNRQSKDEIADRYDLRSVGNTHTLEDQERLSIEEYKRRKRIEAKQREKEKAKRDRVKRLQKAAAANRLKRKLTYLKSKLLGKKRTGPKNEDVGAVDDSESVAAEISSAREEMDNIAGARHRYYDSKTQYASTSTVGDVEPVIIEAATRIEFFDRVDEPEAKRTRPIYVGYTYKDGKINSVLVSFNPQLDPVYQIVPNRIYDGDFYQIKQYRRSDLLREQGDLEHKLFMTLASENDQFNLEKRLNFYSGKHTKIRLALPTTNDASEGCPVELASMTLGALLQKNSRWTTQLVSEGLLKDYNDEVVARYARAAERAELLKTLFPDTSDIEMYRQNPWAQDLLEYKLMVMDDDAFNGYVALIRKKMDEAAERKLKERPRYEW